jgi:iron-sulfur cluster insertion protein
MKVSLKARIFLAGSLEATGKKYCVLSVLSGGCNGMQYSILFVETLPDYEVKEIAPSIFVDTLSLEYLQDSSLELEEDIGSKKIIVKNPNAKTSCSCGSSFSI